MQPKRFALLLTRRMLPLHLCARASLVSQSASHSHSRSRGGRRGGGGGGRSSSSSTSAPTEWLARARLKFNFRVSTCCAFTSVHESKRVCVQVRVCVCVR